MTALLEIFSLVGHMNKIRNKDKKRIQQLETKLKK
jgi:hypothetical protein